MHPPPGWRPFGASELSCGLGLQASGSWKGCQESELCCEASRDAAKRTQAQQTAAHVDRLRGTTGVAPVTARRICSGIPGETFSSGHRYILKLARLNPHLLNRGRPTSPTGRRFLMHGRGIRPRTGLRAPFPPPRGSSGGRSRAWGGC